MFVLVFYNYYIRRAIVTCLSGTLVFNCCLHYTQSASTMSNTPSEGQQTAYQFQFQHPIQYPMSQAQVNYAQQPIGQSQATTSTTTTNQPTATSTTTYQTANTNQTTTQGSTSLGATSSATTLPGSTQQSMSSTSVPQSRSAAELARKDRTLADFMLMLDDHEPLVSGYKRCHIFLKI